MRASSQRGFTLLELLVTLLILAILAAVGVPVYLGMRQRGADSTAMANLRALAPAAAAYHADNETYVGMTMWRLRRDYDRGLPRATFRLRQLTATSYCAETTVGGQTWNRTGPSGVTASGACP